MLYCTCFSLHWFITPHVVTAISLIAKMCSIGENALPHLLCGYYAKLRISKNMHIEIASLVRAKNHQSLYLMTALLNQGLRVACQWLFATRRYIHILFSLLRLLNMLLVLNPFSRLPFEQNEVSILWPKINHRFLHWEYPTTCCFHHKLHFCVDYLL